LSYSTTATREQADGAMAGLVDLLRATRKLRLDIALVTSVALSSVEVTDGYYVQQWIGSDPANHTRWLILRAIQNRAPFRSVFPNGPPDDVEYRYKGRAAEGIGSAHLLDGLAISLLRD